MFNTKRGPVTTCECRNHYREIETNLQKSFQGKTWDELALDMGIEASIPLTEIIHNTDQTQRKHVGGITVGKT